MCIACNAITWRYPIGNDTPPVAALTNKRKTMKKFPRVRACAAAVDLKFATIILFFIIIYLLPQNSLALVTRPTAVYTTHHNLYLVSFSIFLALSCRLSFLVGAGI